MEVANADDLLDRIQEMLSRLESFLDSAERSKDGAEFRAHAGEWRKMVELLAKLRGELAQEGTTNVFVTPQWVELRAVIVAALEPYPAARRALMEAVTEKAKEQANGHV